MLHLFRSRSLVLYFPLWHTQQPWFFCWALLLLLLLSVAERVEYVTRGRDSKIFMFATLTGYMRYLVHSLTTRFTRSALSQPLFFFTTAAHTPAAPPPSSAALRSDTKKPRKDHGFKASFCTLLNIVYVTEIVNTSCSLLFLAAVTLCRMNECLWDTRYTDPNGWITLDVRNKLTECSRWGSAPLQKSLASFIHHKHNKTWISLILAKVFLMIEIASSSSFHSCSQSTSWNKDSATLLLQPHIVVRGGITCLQN